MYRILINLRAGSVKCEVFPLCLTMVLQISPGMLVYSDSRCCWPAGRAKTVSAGLLD